VIDIIGYNEVTINLIHDNLPKNYDLTKFPKELLDEIQNSEYVFKIIVGTWNYNIEVLDTNDNTITTFKKNK
jgi:hypothetical protein